MSHFRAVSAQDRLRDLGEYLRDLTLRVRHLAAEAIGETLSRLAKDASDRLLRKALSDETGPPVGVRTGPYDPWADDDEYVHVSASEPTGRETPSRGFGRTLIAGLLWGTGWWLRKRHSPWAAAAVATAAVVAAVFGNSTGSNEFSSAADLLTAHDALAAGTKVLSRT